VAGGGTGLGRALALGLSDQGAAVAVVGPSGEEAIVADELLRAGRAATSATADLATRDQARAAFAAADALGSTDLIVHAIVDPDALRATPLADVDAATWDRRAEAPLRVALACAQAAFDRLRDRGGRLVFVTPTVALTGAAGLAPSVGALEGIRALAKSAARQWGGHGITVNCVAPPLGLVAPGVADPGGEDPALGRPPDGRADVAPVVALLAAGPAHFVTGATIAVDGGVVMAP
jgi:NAD(P)-dependent dehydrogenase (short-subunit alcohol dehydrogenase family)